jgi:hypothetical protein
LRALLLPSPIRIEKCADSIGVAAQNHRREHALAI